MITNYLNRQIPGRKVGSPSPNKRLGLPRLQPREAVTVTAGCVMAPTVTAGAIPSNTSKCP